jgi:hypothetical protein
MDILEREKFKLDAEFTRVPAMGIAELERLAGSYENLRKEVLKVLMDLDDRQKMLYRLLDSSKTGS